jgi:prepilin-type N-terminal cleavage/methylation domain-containing protein
MNVKNEQSGFSIIEMVISVSLLAVVLASASMAVKRGNDLFVQVSVNNDVSSRSARTINRVVQELRGASDTTFVQDLRTPTGVLPKVWSPMLEFQVAEDWNGAVVWGAPRRLVLELQAGEVDNGLDDNRNGLVDERTLVLLTNPGMADEERLVLAHGVAELLEGELPNGLDDNGNQIVDEQGFCLDLDEDALTIRLTLERMGPQGRVVRTHEDTIFLRN